jgi:hypothetical protein
MSEDVIPVRDLEAVAERRKKMTNIVAYVNI